MKTGKISEKMSVLKAASVYAGLILGAGFASGKELIHFFAKYGYSGIAGIIFSTFILAISGWAVMDICVRNSIKDYNTFITLVLGKFFGNIVDFSVNIFIGVMFCAMLAGSGAMVEEAFALPFSAGVLVVAFFCFAALFFGIEGIVKINLVTTPIMVISGVFLGLYAIFADLSPAFLDSSSPIVKITDNALWSGVIYASYNIITAISVLAGMDKVVTSRGIAKKSGLLGGISMCMLGLVFTIPLIMHKESVGALEMPMLGLVLRYGKVLPKIYIFILSIAITTTALSNAFVVSKWIQSKTKAKKIYADIFVCMFGAGAAHLGFSNFVGKVYPFFGYIGLFEIIVILVYFIFGYNKKH